MKIESRIIIGRGAYRRYEIWQDGQRVYQDSVLRGGKKRAEAVARHESKVREYVTPENEVVERVVNY